MPKAEYKKELENIGNGLNKIGDAWIAIAKHFEKIIRPIEQADDSMQGPPIPPAPSLFDTGVKPWSDNDKSVGYCSNDTCGGTVLNKTKEGNLLCKKHYNEYYEAFRTKNA